MTRTGDQPAGLLAKVLWRPLSRSKLPPFIVLAPAIAVTLLLLVSPVYLAARTLGSGDDVLDLLLRLRMLEILGRTLLLMASVTLACIVIGVPLAWLVARTDLPGRRFFSVALLLPLVIPSYVGGLVAVAALGSRGMLQGFLEEVAAVQRLPDISGFPGAFIVLTLFSYPYVMLTVQAALQRLDPALEETSRGLGYGSRQTFLRVTLPLLRPPIAAAGLLVALYTLSDFGAVSLLNYETLTWAIFVQYDVGIDRSLGAAMSLVLVVVALTALGGEGLVRTGSRYYRSDQGTPRPSPTVWLRGWKWPAAGFCGSVVLAGLLLPVAVLVFWTARGVAAGEPFLLPWQAAFNALYASLLAAGVATGAALPVAIVIVRFPGLLSAVLERITYIGFALPGIAVALGLVFVGANYLPALYQTLGMLVAAYLVLFLPTAVGATRASLLQVNPNLENAARGLGRTPLQTLATVTVPLVRPGLLAGAALVFLLTMKELPATLVLSPIGFDTLATSVWAASSEAFFARAAASALLLLAVSALPLAFLTLRQQQKS